MRVAVLLNHELGFCRRAMSGILRFAEDRPDWVLRDGPPEVELLNALGAWKPDGVIVHLYDGQLAAGLKRIGCPLVSTTWTLDDEDLEWVDVDHREVGREAARYLRGRGLGSFAYFGSETARFSREREAGFREVLGAGVEVLHAEFLPKPPAAEIWRPVGGRIESWLEGLKKPVGVFCSNDLPARRIAEACGQLGIRVPDEVMILGVDNDTSECRLASPQLSSIETPAEQVGFEAARVLSSMMTGVQVPARVGLPPSYVVTRASTDRWASQDEVVRRAIKFMGKELGAGVEVVARKVGVSRRQLERVFRKELRQTVHGVNRELRIEKARELLTTTGLPVAEVGSRSGFGDVKRFGVVFRERMGVGAREFRKLMHMGH